MRVWSWQHFLDRAANSTVKLYASPDGEYESVRHASDPLAPMGQPACSECEDPNELVLLRPAETEVPFSLFARLVDAQTPYENHESARFYLQKHPLHRWSKEGLATEAQPPPHARLAPFLRLQHEFLWLSAAGDCPVAPLHYDEHENLHAVVRGSKRFTLFHPSEGKESLLDGTDAQRSLLSHSASPS
jgi:hypothetical protein